MTKTKIALAAALFAATSSAAFAQGFDPTWRTAIRATPAGRAGNDQRRAAQAAQRRRSGCKSAALPISIAYAG